jgi:hypothetical protein
MQEYHIALAAGAHPVLVLRNVVNWIVTQIIGVMFLQILDVASITLATGERKNLSGFYEKGRIDRTGPKISSRATLMPGVT